MSAQFKTNYTTLANWIATFLIFSLWYYAIPDEYKSEFYAWLIKAYEWGVCWCIKMAGVIA